MFKRLLWFGLGTATGAAGTVWAERRLRAQLERARPDHLAQQARRAVRAALEEGRAAAREREQELRRRYGMPTPRR